MLIIGVVAIAFFVWRLSQRLQSHLEALRNDQTSQLINQNVLSIGTRLDNAKQYFAEMANEMRGLQDMRRNFEDLRNALASSKSRGIFGEKLLQAMLENIFPKEHFELQFRFRNGETVDAVVKTKDGIIPIDSKFPLDNYRKMLAAQSDESRVLERREFLKATKKHITDIAKKYVLPAEGTVAYAVMYVPSEGVFYEIISSGDDMAEFAMQQKVLMTSPNTMAYFLHILRLGFERIRIEENAQKVWELLSGIQQESEKFRVALELVSKHVTNAKGAVDAAGSEYGKLSSRIEQVKQLH